MAQLRSRVACSNFCLSLAVRVGGPVRKYAIDQFLKGFIKIRVVARWILYIGKVVCTCSRITERRVRTAWSDKIVRICTD